MEKLDILQKFSFFRRSNQSFQNELLAAASPVRLPEGSFYFLEGDVCRQLALVGTGSLRVYKVGATGREITLYHVREGESCLLNISCLLTKTPCPASARVESDVEALVFAGGLFRDWVAANEWIREYVFDLLATRIAGVMSLVEEVAFGKMDNRLAQLLGDKLLSNVDAPREFAMTHEQIAAELGTAREVVSRLLKEFERLGAIRLGRGRVFLENRSTLESLFTPH
ncbi:MAG: Crp/Fnr family transcriptional regulator [Candidatus Krumholzibacteria bacterium]|nr:Crp/Fnr family transcriptional regulator [Candidatus Krumholzibacteria bacterium]